MQKESSPSPEPLDQSLEEAEDTQLRTYHLSLLRRPGQHEPQEVTTSPVFKMRVLINTKRYISRGLTPFSQYGLLAGESDTLNEDKCSPKASCAAQDPRIFFNVGAPSSTFICGSQGSGKSHTLSCMLESCLISSDAGKLPRPLTALVFHYDTFISDHGGSPCEAAFLSSNPEIKVRVLCSPTNVRTIQRTYHALNVEIEPLRISQADLNTQRMLDLMAVRSNDGPTPLYLHTVTRILREMRLEQQETGGTFNYGEFKRRLENLDMTPAQRGPLNQRLDTLESFMPKKQTRRVGKEKGKAAEEDSLWMSQPASLTIVDLSCPCVTAEAACSLFNICLSLFLEQSTTIGRVIALDEAHKYMNTSADALAFTDTLLSTIRLQRHLGTRIIISTQEPTISPALLDLCSMTLVHRFTSPEWLHCLRAHLAGLSSDLPDDTMESGTEENGRGKNGTGTGIFQEVVKLKVGEALLFAPSAVVDLDVADGDNVRLQKLGTGFLKVRVRARLTADGGKSVMAS